MNAWPRLALAALAGLVACSSLSETDGGVIALEVPTPDPATVETGDTLQLTVRAINSGGDVVPAAVTWRTADSTINLDASTGLVTGRSPGTARVQAALGSLLSSLVTLNVVARADTVILASDSSLAVPPDQPASPALTVRVESRLPPLAVSGVDVSFAIVDPVFPDPALRSVELGGAGLADTVATDVEGQAVVTVSRVTGTVTPDSVLVEVRAVGSSGEAVPGSGQHFKVRFPT